jgi:hypothetical protein
LLDFILFAGMQMMQLPMATMDRLSVQCHFALIVLETHPALIVLMEAADIYRQLH